LEPKPKADQGKEKPPPVEGLGFALLELLESVLGVELVEKPW